MEPKVNPSRPGGDPAGGSPTELAGIGVQFALVLIAFLFGGRWLDAKLGTEPWLLMAGVFVGFGLSVYWMYRRLNARNPRGR
jgi:ATP synthase protein I